MCVEGDGHIKQLLATFCPCDKITDFLLQDPCYLVDVLWIALSRLGELVGVGQEAVRIREGVLKTNKITN